MAKTATRYPSTRVSVLKAAQRDPKTGKLKKPNPAGPFANLTWEQQRVAEQWLWKFCARWEGNLPQWRRAILIGVAKRLAVNPPLDSAWSLHCFRVRSGKASQRRHRAYGIDTAKLMRAAQALKKSRSV